MTDNKEQFTRWNGLIEKVKNEKLNSAEQIRNEKPKTAPTKKTEKGEQTK